MYRFYYHQDEHLSESTKPYLGFWGEDRPAGGLSRNCARSIFRTVMDGTVPLYSFVRAITPVVLQLGSLVGLAKGQPSPPAARDCT